MKRFTAIIILTLLVIVSCPASAEDTYVQFSDYVYYVPVGNRLNLTGLIDVCGGEGYEISSIFMVYDETFAGIDGDIFITKRTGNTTVTAIYYFSDGAGTFDRYATCDIRIKNDGSLVRTCDINLDGVINADDLSLILSEYMTSDELCDLNGDGIVNASDLSNLLHRYGKIL